MNRTFGGFGLLRFDDGPTRCLDIVVPCLSTVRLAREARGQRRGSPDDNDNKEGQKY